MSGRCDAALAEFPPGAVNESGVCSPASSEPTYRQQVLSSAKCDGGLLKRVESGTATCRGSEQGPSVGHVGASCVLSPADALLNLASESMSMGFPVRIRHYATNTSTTWLGSSRKSIPQKLCTSKGWMYCAEQGVAKMNAGKRSADKIHTAVVSLQAAPLELDPCTLVTGTTLLVNLYSIHNLYHFVKDNLATLMWTLHASGETGTDARILIPTRLARSRSNGQSGRHEPELPKQLLRTVSLLPWLTAFSRHPISAPVTPSAVRTNGWSTHTPRGWQRWLCHYPASPKVPGRPWRAAMFRDNLRRRYLAAGSSNHVHQTNQNVAGKAGRVFLNLEAGIASVLDPSQRSCRNCRVRSADDVAAMSLMARTDILIGSHGAGLSNSVFLPSCAQMLELMPKDIKVGSHSMPTGSRKGYKYAKISLPTTMKDITLPLALLADSADAGCLLAQLPAAGRRAARCCPEIGQKHSHKRH